MHRSRLSMLVIFAAVAACSKRDDSQGTELLSQDRTLVAKLEVDQESRQLSLPPACGKIAVPAQSAVANQQQAKELTRQAHDAELHGDLEKARTLLRRASELDASNKSAAYHLGRTSEALGDRTTALTAYCRYLVLTPTTSESLEARQRVAELSKSQTRVAAGSVIDSVPTPRRAPAATVRRVTRKKSTVEPRVVASAPVKTSEPAPASPERTTSSAPAVTSGGENAPTPSAPVADSQEVAAGTAEGSAAEADVVVAPRPAPPVEQPPTAPRTQSGPTRTQSAILGAATGGLIGAAAGRSVKSAVIGAAAGGILGSVMGPRIGPVGRGIVSNR